MTLSIGFYLGGYLVGILAFYGMARRRNLATEGILWMIAVALVGGLLGANLMQWFATGTAGKTVLGGIAGGWLNILLYKHWVGIRRPTGDLFAVAISAGEAVGRWGCFFGGCCYGKVTAVPWAIWQHEALRHPTQAYLSLANLLILFALWRFDRTHPPENALFYLQGLLYCLARFGIEFWRETPPPIGGLSSAQWFCLVGSIGFGLALARLLARSESQSQLPSRRDP